VGVAEVEALAVLCSFLPGVDSSAMKLWMFSMVSDSPLEAFD
jgi:hypothetical protein